MDMEPHKEDIESSRFEGWQDNYNTLVLRLDPSPTLEKIKHMLLNQKYNPDKEEWVPIPNLKPRMKKEGVEKLMLELYSRMSIDKVLSNLKEPRVNVIVRQVGEVTLNFLWHEADYFEILESEYDSIFWIIVHNVDMFIRRAQNAQENILLNKGMKFTESTSINRAPQQQDQQPSRFPFVR